jgi:hypothetical protein
VIAKEGVPINGFYHRPNADGTENSICSSCNSIIASSPNEADLDTAEAGHSCRRKFGETQADRNKSASLRQAREAS